MSILDKKTPWARKKLNGPLQVPDLYKPVDLHFATNFIAERMADAALGTRTLNDRVRHQIKADRQSGLLPSQNGMFVFGELIAWAKNKKTLAAAVAGLMHIGHASATLTAPSMRLSATGYSLPASLAESQEALVAAYRDLNVLRSENMLLTATVAELLPYKERADAIKHNGRVSGYKGGRPPIK
jgi:hypothetical protein